ncbi:hypothetical protein, partial [Mesorhizobium sp. M4B.F.Ca.ET.143.01.1.1]|uniref:hypothetical protein n=1 Tax=Mesorhizobium sp. M4B.F.Ca.ET.143.01.1.1 TaxID=2563947 RepID=UPI001AED8F58
RCRGMHSFDYIISVSAFAAPKAHFVWPAVADAVRKTGTGQRLLQFGYASLPVWPPSTNELTQFDSSVCGRPISPGVSIPCLNKVTTRHLKPMLL